MIGVTVSVDVSKIGEISMTRDVGSIPVAGTTGELVGDRPLVDGYRVVGIPWNRGTRIAREIIPRPPDPRQRA